MATNSPKTTKTKNYTPNSTTSKPSSSKPKRTNKNISKASINTTNKLPNFNKKYNKLMSIAKTLNLFKFKKNNPLLENIIKKKKTYNMHVTTKH
jgi:hypothetical protein